jgi:hypothetical protein
MDPITRYDFTKLQMAERHEQAALARMAKAGRSFDGIDEQETSVWRRWIVRQLVGRISLGHAGS